MTTIENSGVGVTPPTQSEHRRDGTQPKMPFMAAYWEALTERTDAVDTRTDELWRKVGKNNLFASPSSPEVVELSDLKREMSWLNRIENTMRASGASKKAVDRIYVEDGTLTRLEQRIADLKRSHAGFRAFIGSTALGSVGGMLAAYSSVIGEESRPGVAAIGILLGACWGAMGALGHYMEVGNVRDEANGERLWRLLPMTGLGEAAVGADGRMSLADQKLGSSMSEEDRTTARIVMARFEIGSRLVTPHVAFFTALGARNRKFYDPDQEGQSDARSIAPVLDRFMPIDPGCPVTPEGADGRKTWAGYLDELLKPGDNPLRDGVQEAMGLQKPKKRL